MAAPLIGGVMLAKALKGRLKEKVSILAKVGIVQRLAVILVGDRLAS